MSITIESTQQMDVLPPETIVTLRHEGQGTEQWKKTTDSLWENLTRTGARPIDSSKFRGAVKAGRVRRVAPGETPDLSDPNQWKIGDWWVNASFTDRAWLVYSEDRTGNVHNCMLVYGGQAQRTVLTEHIMREGQGYSRVSDVADLPETINWFTEGMVPVLQASTEKVPDGLVEAVVEFANDNDNDDLFNLLSEKGVDTSVMTQCEMSGTVTIPKTNISALIGSAVNVGGEVDVEWDHTFQVKVRRGCICSEAWRDVVVDAAAVLSVIPVGTTEDDTEISLSCPLHD